MPEQNAVPQTYDDFRALAHALSCGAAASCECQRLGRKRAMVHCPAHHDEHPSLSLTFDRDVILFHCFAGCAQDRVLDALRRRDLWPSRAPHAAPSGRGLPAQVSRQAAPPQGAPRKEAHGHAASVAIAPVSSEISYDTGAIQTFSEKTKKCVCKDPETGATAQRRNDGVTLEDLAKAKGLPVEALQHFGLRNCKHRQLPAVRIPYVNAEGEEVAIRYRLALSGSQRFAWRARDKVAPYRLRFDLAEQAGWILIVEGESDCWTMWHHDLPAIGIPGKSTWQGEWAAQLAGLDVYLWQEPDAPELPAKIARNVPQLKVIPAPEGYKDVSDYHQKDPIGFVAWFEALRAAAVPYADLADEKTARLRARLAEMASPVLSYEDPFEMVAYAIRHAGYGGDLRAPLIVYLAATSRLLLHRPGAMPVHLILIGPPSSGKSYTVNTALALLPEEAQHVIAAGTPRVLIYDDADLRHRAVIFGEADSLPDDEDGSAASAIRNLLQDGYLHYDTAVREPATGDFVVRTIEKEGPTVLITTAVKWLGEQLMTRFFALEVDDTPEQVRQSLLTQAKLELEGAPPADAALIAFQALLQSQAPWDVIVPFADRLAQAIIGDSAAPRLNRDFARLLSLIKAVTVLRYRGRRCDANGRLIATLEDYTTVRGLVNEMYIATTADGASERVQEAVRAAIEIYSAEKRTPVGATAVARALGIALSSATRRLHAAVKRGWLINEEQRRGRPMRLVPGDPLPVLKGLPEPEELER